MKKNSVLKFEMGNVTITVIMQGFCLTLQKGNSEIHNHASFEFHMIMQGSVTLNTGSGSMEFSENDSVLIPPEFFHGFKRPDKESADLAFSFYVEKNRKKKCADYFSLMQKYLRTSNHILTFRQNTEIKECLKKMQNGRE